MTAGPGLCRRRLGFSLLEIMIAIGVLGIGLIMISSIFPVALTQHRETVERASALQMVDKAEAMLRSRINPSQLFFPQQPGSVPPLYPPLGDSRYAQWFMVPGANLAVNPSVPNLPWSDMVFTGAPNDRSNYANWVSFYNPGNPDFNPAIAGQGNNAALVFGLDILSDRNAPFLVDNFSPFTQSEFEDAPWRFAWTGFYRRLPNATIAYAAAVCQVQRGQRFAQQNVPGVATEFSAPTADPSVAWRLPVPWRVTVSYNRPSRSLSSAGANGEGIGELAPAGSQLMVQGKYYQIVPPPTVTNPDPVPLVVPSGRILTVANVIDDRNVGILEDYPDLPAIFPYTHVNNVNYNYQFDVWVFPPEIIGGTAQNASFGKKSPLVQWKVFM